MQCSLIWSKFADCVAPSEQSTMDSCTQHRNLQWHSQPHRPSRCSPPEDHVRHSCIIISITESNRELKHQRSIHLSFGECWCFPHLSTFEYNNCISYLNTDDYFHIHPISKSSLSRLIVRWDRRPCLWDVVQEVPGEKHPPGNTFMKNFLLLTLERRLPDTQNPRKKHCKFSC